MVDVAQLVVCKKLKVTHTYSARINRRKYHSHSMDVSIDSIETSIQPVQQVNCIGHRNVVKDMNYLDEVIDVKSQSLEVINENFNNLDNSKYKQYKNKNKRIKKELMNIVTINIRTLGRVSDEEPFLGGGKRRFKSDKLPLVAYVAKKNNFDLVCLQEVKRIGSGVLERDGYTLYYSGQEQLRREAVGILMKNEFVKDVVECKFVSSRIMVICGKFHNIDMSIVSIYAPTNTYDSNMK